jgi:hypothetical protein
MYRVMQIPVTTTGLAGAAVGTGTVGLPWGKLVALAVNWDGAAPITSDITVEANLPVGVAKTLYAKDNSATDVPLIQPRVLAQDDAGDDIADVYVEPLVGGHLLVTVAQCDELDPAVTVTVVVAVD